MTEHLIIGPAERYMLCPNCGAAELHHFETTVYERAVEDQAGMAFTISGPSHFTKEPVHANKIPGRRNSVKIFFWCEQCDRISTLFLLQHKGTSFLSFSATGKSKVPIKERSIL